MIIESVAAAGAILSTISTAINKLNEVGDGAAKAVELMQGFSDALDSFEREKKDSVISNLSSQELLKLESIKHRRDQWEKSLHDMLEFTIRHYYNAGTKLRQDRKRPTSGRWKLLKLELLLEKK